MEKKKTKRIFKSISSEQLEKLKKGGSLLTIADTCKFLSVNRATLRRWTQSGLVIQHSLGGRKYYKRKEILKGLKKNTYKNNMKYTIITNEIKQTMPLIELLKRNKLDEPTDEKVYTFGEACKILDASRSKVYELMKQGVIEYKKCGSKIKIKESKLFKNLILTEKLNK